MWAMMVQEPELEEGETCYYKDDANIDPDIALSYIGDKVQSILGHLQKDFEGGVCAENLGAKFGGYGSFLPTHQRSPSIWSQPKSPPRVQISHLPRSPNACPEGLVPKSVIPSTQRDDASSSPSVRASQTLKTSSHAASIRQKTTLSSGIVAETFPGKVELPSSKFNPRDQRTLKVRIKVGPERVAQYNAQIYSLGLTSPSSSEGNSHDESDELLPETHEIPKETHEIPKESPAYILKMMTSFPVSDGLLLSPLCEDLLNLTREREYLVESEYEAAPKNSAISIKILNNDASRGKKTKAVDKRGNFDKSKDNLEDLDGSVQKTFCSDYMECNMQPVNDLNCKSLPDKVKGSDKNALIIARESKNWVKGGAVSGDSVKDVTFEHTSDQSHGKYEQLNSRCSSRERIEEKRARISQKDVSVVRGQVGKSGGKGSYDSFKAYSDHSEGERVEKAMDDSTMKTGLNSISSGFDPRPMGRSSIEGGKKLKVSKSSGKNASKSDSFKDDDCAAPEKKSSGRKDVHKLHLGKKDVVHTSLEHMEHPKHILERPSVDSSKNFNLDDIKSKPALADKLKERPNNKKYLDRVSSDSPMVEPPAAAIQSKEGILSGLEQTVAAPVLIQEDWVGCDRCQKWRLLPYGTKSLPEKWVCSMQNWLPGLNRCDVSEDETTAAVRALSQVPAPENQHNFQAHANGTMAGAITATAHDFNQSHLNVASDQMKKQKLKKRQSSVGTSYSLHSNSQMQMPRLDLENGSSKDVKPSARVNIANQSDMQYPNKSASVSAKLNKRKGDHVIGDDSNPRKKIKESGEYLHGKGQSKRIESTNVPIVDSVQNSCGNLGVKGHSVTSGFPSKTAVKHGKKKSAPKDGISGGLGNIQINVKHENSMQDLPDNGPLDVEICNGRQVTAKKIKLKDYVYSQHQVETQHNNGSLQDRKASVNKDSKDGDIHRDKKPRVSHIEYDEFSRGQDGDISKRSVEIRPLGAKEYPTSRSIEKEHQVKKPRAKMHLTIEDIDELRKDLGCEHLSMAATSSSSKVSDSRKNRLSYVEVKGSPEESVSSSPMRMLYPNQVSPLMAETTGKVDCMFNDIGAVSSVKKIQDMNESSELGTAKRRTSGLTILDTKNKLKKDTAVDDNHHAPKHEVSSNMRHPLSHDLSLKSVKNPSVGKNNIRKSKDSRSEKQSTQREHVKNNLESSNPCNTDVMQQNLKQDHPRSSIEQVSAQMEPWNGKVRIDLRQGDKQGAPRPSKHASGSMGSLKRNPMDSKPRDASVLGDTSKALKGTTISCVEDRTENLIDKEAVALDTSLRNKNVSGATASTGLKEAEDVLKEAEELRTHADLIKNSGFGTESNYEYFKAGLKFLLGASLLEACNAEPSKQLETSPMQMYGVAAQLCKTCASEYEKGHELTFAALAYKCMEVAYLRVVYCKSSSASRFCQDLQSSLQMVPQGESPSSSASDVDNLNNLAMADKVTLSKGSGSHAGNHVIVPRNRPNFVRLVDFTKDVNSAMEAAKKSQDTFAAAHVELKKSQNQDAIVSVKRVIDFSFQDVEELVRLVWLAFNTINHQGLRGDRE